MQQEVLLETQKHLLNEQQKHILFLSQELAKTQALCESKTIVADHWRQSLVRRIMDLQERSIQLTIAEEKSEQLQNTLNSLSDQLNRTKQQLNTVQNMQQIALKQANHKGMLAVYDEWTALMDLSTSLELHVGTSMTDSQYDGLRFAMAFSFLGNRFKKRKLKCLGLPIPCPKSRYAMQNIKKEIETKVGLHSVGPNSVLLEIEGVIERCIAQNPNGIGGTHHFQVSVDAMRQYRNCKVTNLAVRSLSNDPNYDHLNSLNVAG